MQLPTEIQGHLYFLQARQESRKQRLAGKQPATDPIGRTVPPCPPEIRDSTHPLWRKRLTGLPENRTVVCGIRIHSTADTRWNDPTSLQLLRFIRREKYSRALWANRFTVQEAHPSEFDLADPVSNYAAEDEVLRWIARQ